MLPTCSVALVVDEISVFNALRFFCYSLHFLTLLTILYATYYSFSQNYHHLKKNEKKNDSKPFFKKRKILFRAQRLYNTNKPKLANSTRFRIFIKR